MTEKMTDFSKEEFEQIQANINKKFDQHKLIVTQRKWRAYLSADQLNITDVTWTKVQFDTIDYDCEGVGFTTYGYPVQENGMLLVKLNIYWEHLIVDKNWTAAIYLNAVQKTQAENSTSRTSYIGVYTSDIIEVNVGDVVYGYAFHDAGVNTPDIIGGTKVHTYMTVHKLSRLCK